MISDALFDISSFYIFLKNQGAQFSVIFVLTLAFVVSYTVSIISGILLAAAFFLGIISFNAIWTSKVIESLSLFEASSHPPTSKAVPACNVCCENQCKRQKSLKDNQPWLTLNISKDVDQAIQDLLNKILNEFVTSWHSKFTKDESFIIELRRCLRYASSILLKRLLLVDISEVITDQLAPIALSHINDYLHILQLSSKEKITVEEASVKYLNKRLHFAARSRKSEIQYLRCLSDLLLNYIAQAPQLKCMSFRVLIRELLGGWVFLSIADTLCDPFCINSLILLTLSHEPLTEYPDNSALKVQFLHRFVIQNKDFASKKSVFQSNLSFILKDQKLLYVFMQFLKKEGVVHLLQFCLQVEEFSKRILKPELEKSEMNDLFKEACDLFSIYFKSDSSDSIHFPKQIVQQMEQGIRNRAHDWLIDKQFLDCGASNITRLVTNPVLFKAYEVAYAILDESYCPLFYLSNEYYLLLIEAQHTGKYSSRGTFGSPAQPGSPVKGRGAKKTTEVGVVGKLSSKFNKLLQFQPVEGRAYCSDGTPDLAEAECAEDLVVESLHDSLNRDMSTWKVSVPYVTTKQDPNSKPYPVFNINVTTIEAKDNANLKLKSKWNVERRFNDFYVLQAKLAEFHGEFEDGTQLPSKTGMFSPRGSEFLENRRQLFEEYLQKLLQKPSLRGSDLLFFFLHSPAEFSSCLTVQEGIGKIIRRSVEPIKLRKERGQRLENFLNVFLSSTEGHKKSGKYEWQDVNVKRPRKKRDITRTIYSNNFEEFICRTEVNEEITKEALLLIGPWDCILYALSNLMGASKGVIQAFVMFKNILGQSSDLLVRQLIRKKLEALLVSARISHMVRLLQDALFNSNYEPGNEGHKNLRNLIKLEVGKFTNNFLMRWFLPNCHGGVEVMVDSVQFPVLNKHLYYCLLDEVVRVLFPELATS